MIDRRGLIMKIVLRQTQLYTFLKYCNESGLERKVLDCGAGGSLPPLILFKEHGYITCGIEIDQAALDKAQVFEREYSTSLGIIKGDMRRLPFGDKYFSHVYSYNSIFHMTKADIGKSINELKRVLKPGGLMFVNFASIYDFRYGQDEKVGEGEFLHPEDGEPVLHSYYDTYEADKYFDDMKIIHKENRILERTFEGEMITQGYIDYIARKPI